MIAISNNKPKDKAQSLSDLQQRLHQLKLDLDSAQHKNNPQLVKDISRAIATTQLVYNRIKHG